MTTPRIYVACLSSYNSDIAHGEWIDAIDADELREGIRDMLAKSSIPGAEEWEIQDEEGFGPLQPWGDVDKLAELGALIDEHGEAYAAYADNVSIDYATEEAFEDSYEGEWDSEKDFAENLFDDLYDVSTPIAPYIDYDAFARDLFIGDYYSVPSLTGVFVFRNC